MGNCIRKGSSAEWGGDDWGSFGRSSHKTRVHGDVTYNHNESKDNNAQDYKSTRIGESNKDGYLTTSSLEAGTDQVKIKVSKKQLEQLLKTADIEGLTVQQVLARLMDDGDQFESHDRRSWSPDLQSISE